MAETFEDRVEEVLGTLHGWAWPLLDESQKRKIIGKVVKGIDKHGDSNAAWARALSLPAQTLRDQVLHFRSSEPIDGSRATAETQRKRVSHARSVLRNPEMAAEVIGSLKPAEREAIFDVAAASLDHASDSPRVSVPQMDPWSEVTQTMALIDRQTRHLAERIDKTRMSEHREDELEEWIEAHESRIQALRTKEGRADLRLVVGGV